MAGEVRDLDQTIRSVLNDAGPKIATALSMIMQSAYRDNDSSATYVAGLALQNLMSARLYTNRFLLSGTPDDLGRVRAEVTAAQEQFEKLDNELQNPERRTALSSAQQEFKRYSKGIDDVATAVASIERKVHDTLDQLGPSLAQLAVEVRDSVKADQDRIGPSLQSELGTARLAIGLVTLAALLVGIVFSRLATMPVKRLLGLIRTLSEERE